MDKKRRLTTIFIVIIALIILIGLIFFIFLAPTPEIKEELPIIPESNLPVGNDTTQSQTQINNTPIQRVIPQSDVTEYDLKRITSSFVERYGTYSNQAGYGNIKDLEIFMSREMKNWSNNYVQQLIKNNSNTDIYYGITTKTVVVETDAFNKASGKVEFTAKTQRKESIGTEANTRKFQQDAKVTIIKEGGVWKVDRVIWEE